MSDTLSLQEQADDALYRVIEIQDDPRATDADRLEAEELAVDLAARAEALA